MIDTNNFKNELKRITDIFLAPHDNYGDLFNQADALYQLLLTVSCLEPDETISREDIYLPEGKALGPIWAARCVKEFMRTKRFLSGIFKAVKEAQKRFPGTQLHILYAGTGPFATLILPLTTAFSSREICFTLLEINPHSIECLRHTLKGFDIEDYVNDVVCCDAARYKADTALPIHMIISETMLNALRREPQTAITLNLAPQMVEGGIWVPQSIVVEAGLLNNKRFTERMQGINTSVDDHYYLIKKIFVLDKNTCKTPPEYNPENDLYTFPKETIELPHGISEDYKQLCLFTTIQVFGDEFLTHWQCSLNLPQKILDLWRQEKKIEKVSFQYVISTNPGFRHFIES